MTFRMLVAVFAATLTLTACSSSDTSAPSGPEAEKGASEKLVETSPLTGKELPDGRPDNPVFVVKVENTEGGAPQYGLDKADLVVEELVEGGLTRLAAFYYSNLPSKVGHVRSIRGSDIGIAAPVGGQVVASGGAGGTVNRVKNAGITVLSEDNGAAGFSDDPAKTAPYNRLVNLKTLAKKAKPSKIRGPYLPWTPKKSEKSDAAKRSKKKATSATVAFSNSTRTQWALKGKTWQRTNGHASPGSDFEADTLVVMFCDVGDAGYLDPAGNPVPETELEGSGRAVLLNGKDVTEATWSKRSKRTSIDLEAKDGSPVTVDPGNAFVELVPKGAGSISLD